MEKDTPVETRDDKPGKSRSRNGRVVLICLCTLGVMIGITAASPTLYTMFCSATGYNGTTQRVNANANKVLDRTITVRFDTSTAPGLPWTFESELTKMDIKIGETGLAFFRATNNSDKPVTGRAVYNVTPEIFGSYFNKIQCFCFTEQTLQPHQTVEMPVTFFIDPKMVEDRDASVQSEVTLSYVFYPVDHPAATADASAPKKSGG